MPVLSAAPVANISLLQAAIAYRRRQYRETGRWASELECLRVVGAMSPAQRAAECRTPGREYDRLRQYLADERYTPAAIEGATYDACRCGTLADSGHIDDIDREAVEELLPSRV